MMSEKLDWTQMVGDAFLAQESDVMDTVQQLRQRAYAADNLKSTEKQQVTVEDNSIRIEPTNPEVVTSLPMTLRGYTARGGGPATPRMSSIHTGPVWSLLRGSLRSGSAASLGPSGAMSGGTGTGDIIVFL